MNNIELLAPVGDFECLKAAVQNGADSVYFGANMFNARASAQNFDLDALKQAIEYCNLRNVKSHLTLNILIKNNEFEEAVFLAKKAYEFGINSIIVQDYGLARFLIENFPYMNIHGSTQMSVHNLEGAIELEKLGFKRVVLARELAINEIEYICNNSNIETEVFIHGALCISYSGQCLFSSLVGGRSGNRGKCAGPCRLPYELISENKKTKKVQSINKGYLLSTKDLCGLSFIPRLIDIGVTSLKIEGRMKTPEYVATVTRIYRKYIDLALSNKDYIIDEHDIKDLMQVFNRGGFSTGHLYEKENKQLVFQEKPNNMGLYIGNISHYNKNKGLITIQTLEPLTIGDTVSTEKENTIYTISELMSKDKNIVSTLPNKIVTFGRMKGNISIGDKVFKISSKTLNNAAKFSYENYENKKILLNASVTVKQNKPITLLVSTLENESNDAYKNIKVSLSSDIIPSEALTSPITEERIINQINKTTKTPFEFNNINVNLDDNLYIPGISILNELRRSALLQVKNIILDRFSKKSNLANEQIDKILTSKINKNIGNNPNSAFKKEISILFNNIDLNYDYSKLDFSSIANCYIPISFFMNKEYFKILNILNKNLNMYIYLPVILKANYKNILKNTIDKIIANYTIKGFVISNISGFEMLKDYKNYEFIGNHTLNIFNTISVSEYQKLGSNTFTFSTELDKENLLNLSKINNIKKELIVYGNMPLMYCNYCYLSKSNKCYPNCGEKCTLDNSYYLKDRLGMKFRIMPNNIQTITTIYNCKKLSIDSKDFNVNSLRVDILDETIDEINNVIKIVKEGNCLKGKDYTNGNLNREI